RVTLGDQTRAAHLVFSPGQVNTVAGFTGCNRLTGSFELLTDNMIKFSPLAVTKMACMNSGDAESNFLSALNKTSKWIIRNRELYFYEEDKLLVKFASVDAAVAKLEGNWELNYISGSRIAFDGLYKEKMLLGFANNEFRVLITKTKIAQFGLNYQNCRNQIFEVRGVTSLNTTNLQGVAFDWRHYGGPLAILRLCRYVRFEILKDTKQTRKRIPIPKTIYQLQGGLILKQARKSKKDK
ncbi:MAG: META domain-containing protein, partial [Nitrospira sp.]|nr:META domain-containing protein [Nitrospira sp.]